MSLLLYIHGFNSSPQSHKSQATCQWLQEHHPDVEFKCPQLSNHALEAIGQLETLITEYNGEVWLAGSSMGGYYATWLAEKYGLRAVLINPAVRPYLGMGSWLGENANYHTGETWVMEPHHIDEFRVLEVEKLQRPQNFRVLLQTGDEVLDYRDAEQKYRDSEVRIEQGGDHSFQNYERHLPDIYQFLSQSGRKG